MSDPSASIADQTPHRLWRLLTFMAVLLIASSLLAVFEAPVRWCWYLALIATEWGYFLAFFCAGLAALLWVHNRHRWLWMIALSVATGMYLSPLVRAWHMAEGVPQEFATALGAVSVPSDPRAPARAAPIVWNDLWTGIAQPPVEMTTWSYNEDSNAPLWLDLYRPMSHPVGSGRGLPVVVIVHGGSWQVGDRHELPALNRYLAARGYAVVAPDYRLAPQATFPAPLQDLQMALLWLKNHATELGLDMSGVVLMGRSAGGQVALTIGYRGDPLIKGVIALYAPNDLLFAYRHRANPWILDSEGIIRGYMGGTPEQVPQRYDEASPLMHVGAQTPPTLLVHGLRDELVWSGHSQRLAQKMREAHRPYYALFLPWATHGCDVHFSGPAGQLITFTIERFLAKVLPVAPPPAVL